MINSYDSNDIVVLPNETVKEVLEHTGKGLYELLEGFNVEQLENVLHNDYILNMTFNDLYMMAYNIENNIRNHVFEWLA
jgi:hypothetical protein